MLEAILFVGLLFVDTLSLRCKYFSVSLFINILTKIFWITFSFCSVFDHKFTYFVVTIMCITAIMILMEDNAKRFFALSNIVQMCFIAQQKYFDLYFVSLMTSNLVVWAVLSTIKKYQLNDHTCIENLWGLFSKSKFRGSVLIFNLLILSGIVPAYGSFYRYNHLFVMHIIGQNYIFWTNIISFIILIYAYLRWIIAVLLKKEIEHNEVESSDKLFLQKFFIWLGFILAILNIAYVVLCIIISY